MDDMPMWMKLLIWIVVGATALWTIVSLIRSSMGESNGEAITKFFGHFSSLPETPA